MTKVVKGGPTSSQPDMTDAADHDVHSGNKTAPNPGDDLWDPGEEIPGAPHDRTVNRKGGRHEGAGSQMQEKVLEGGKAETEAWRKGKTQNS